MGTQNHGEGSMSEIGFFANHRRALSLADTMMGWRGSPTASSRSA
jgi:hypothetical protein